MDCAIVWLRRDLRLGDNTALHAACTEAKRVVPVFVRDPVLLRAAGEPRRWFLAGALDALSAALRARGSRLVVCEGRPAEVLPRLARACKAEAVFFNRDYTPYAKRRDRAVAAALAAIGVRVRSFKDLVLHEEGEVLTRAGVLPRVFAVYQRGWSRLPVDPPLPAPALPPLPDALPASMGEAVPSLAASPLSQWWVPSEAGARAALEHFATELLGRYAAERDFPGSDVTSRLSPHLHVGTISPRTAIARVRAAAQSPTERRGLETFARELCFRDFYMALLAAIPRLRRHPLNPAFERVGGSDSGLLAAWQEGRTGYPIVDAGMRQLAAEGWMHNRVRMIVASFLTKDLLLDYRLGERFFMERLVDGDVANNNAGWQWSASTGVDAQPYFRIFNPVAQGEKFDPRGTYVRRYVPELARVPLAYLHHPWDMPEEVQQASGCCIGQDYPRPIVDHAIARDRALARYRAAAYGRHPGP